MSKKYLLYRRKTAIIITDALLFAIAFSVYGVLHFKYHWSLGIITFLMLYVGFYYAFFLSRIIRYILSIIFSLFYGVLFSLLGANIDKENVLTPTLVFGILAFLISLYLHKDHFNFLKDAEYYEYDRY